MGSLVTTRLTAPVVAVSLLLLGVAGGAAWYVQRLQARSSELLVQNVSSVRAAEELEIGLREVQARLDSFLITTEEKHLDAIRELKEETDRSMERVAASALTQREQVWVGRIRYGYDRFFAELDRRTHQSNPWQRAARIHSIIDQMLVQEVLDPAHEYLKFNEAALDQASRENRELASRLAYGLLILGVCGAGAGVTAGAGVAWAVRRSIVQVQVRLRDAAGRLGETAGPVTVVESGDLGDLDAALARLEGPITDLVSRFQQTQREALRAEQLAMVGQMAAGVAHEVRNPLMAIKLLVQNAVERDGHLAGRGLCVLEEEVVRLERLTRTLLEFARPPRPEKCPVRVQSAVAHMLELLRGKAALQKVRFDLKAPAGPAFVEADSGHLHQLLFNLVQNAVEASPAGGVVEIEVETTPAEVAVRVRDSGPGLPAHLGQQIFEPFVSTKETGVGLGLSICRRIAEEHGGVLAAADRPGGGAEFAVRLARLPSAESGVA